MRHKDTARTYYITENPPTTKLRHFFKCRECWDPRQRNKPIM